MGAYAVSVEKEVQFRAASEMISNVYHYRIDAPVSTDYEALADLVVARDRQAYPAEASYKMVRVWGPTEGSQADSKMRVEKVLSVVGLRTTVNVPVYPELSYVVSIFVGRSPVHNRKIFVRKFIRAIKLRDSSSSATTGGLTTGERDYFATWMNDNKQIGTFPAQFTMVTPKNVLVPSSEVAKCLPFLHVRQIKQ